MNTFALTVCDAAECRRFASVSMLVAADASGSFGILPHHRGMVAVLRYGMARFREADGAWRFIAMPGGVLRFAENEATIVSARCHIGSERDRIAEALAAELAREDSELHAAHATLEAIEQALLRRLAELGTQLHGAPA